MVIWIVSMVMMKSNVQGTSVWMKINSIASKIKLASKLLNDVMEHLIVLVRPLKYKELRSTYIRGVLTHTTALNQHWRGDETLNKWLSFTLSST